MVARRVVTAGKTVRKVEIKVYELGMQRFVLKQSSRRAGNTVAQSLPEHTMSSIGLPTGMATGRFNMHCRCDAI